MIVKMRNVTGLKNIDKQPQINQIKGNHCIEAALSATNDDSMQIWMARGFNIYKVNKPKNFKYSA